MTSPLFSNVARRNGLTLNPGSDLHVRVAPKGQPSIGSLINLSTLRSWERKGLIRNTGADGQRRYILTQAGYAAA